MEKFSQVLKDGPLTALHCFQVQGMWTQFSSKCWGRDGVLYVAPNLDSNLWTKHGPLRAFAEVFG